MKEHRGSSGFSFKLKMTLLVFIYVLTWIHDGNAADGDKIDCATFKKDASKAEDEAIKMANVFSTSKVTTKFKDGKLCSDGGTPKTEDEVKRRDGELCDYKYNVKRVNDAATEKLGKEHCESGKCSFQHKTNQFVCGTGGSGGGGGDSKSKSTSTQIEAIANFVASLMLFSLGLGQVLS